jgi:hypothetical protein
VARLTALAAVTRRLRRRRAVWLGTIGAALLTLAVLVGLAVADIDVPLGRPSEPSHHLAFLSGSGSHVARKHGRPPGPVSTQAALTIAPDAAGTPVPSSFFGLSTEYWALPLFERDTPAFERVLALLHVAGDGPLILRIGGDSADQSFWSPRWKTMPRWAFALTPAYLSRLRGLVLRDRVKLIVDLNLVTATPLTAAEWAHAAETALPHGSISAFEIGNEPDLYGRRFWADLIARTPLATRSLPLELTPDLYVQDFAAYARVLGESAPDIPLVGPAIGHPRLGLPFISALIADQRSELGMVTGHLYPYTGCPKNPRSPAAATVARVLSRKATSAFSTDIASAVALAHRAGLKFRLTEFNSVTCGGKPGVSNTFATALWAPDALFTAMSAGADGANLHVHMTSVNAAFTINRYGLNPRPLLYGLMLFTRTLGPQARLVPLRLTAARSLNLSAWAVEIRGRILHVLLIDKGTRTVHVAVRLPASATGTVERLLAPSAYSRSGVTLNGQQLNYAAEWTGTPSTETIAPGARGGYELTVYRRSAALMSVQLGSPRPVSEHHRRVSVTKHAVLAVGLDRPRKH